MTRLWDQLKSIGLEIGIGWFVAVSLLTFVFSIVVARMFIVRMPADFLTRAGTKAKNPNTDVGPVHSTILWLFKNTIGAMLLVAGFIMLFIPGQGILFMLLGLSLLSFPGKRKLIRRMLKHKSVLKTINKIRKSADRPPLDLPNSH